MIICFFKKITKNPFHALSATTSSIPFGRTVLKSRLPELPPDHIWPRRESHHQIFIFSVDVSATHKRPYADKHSFGFSVPIIASAESRNPATVVKPTTTEPSYLNAG